MLECVCRMILVYQYVMDLWIEFRRVAKAFWWSCLGSQTCLLFPLHLACMCKKHYWKCYLRGVLRLERSSSATKCRTIGLITLQDCLFSLRLRYRKPTGQSPLEFSWAKSRSHEDFYPSQVDLLGFSSYVCWGFSAFRSSPYVRQTFNRALPAFDLLILGRHFP